MTTVVIAGAKRTPIGALLGQFTGVPATVLGTAAIQAAVQYLMDHGIWQKILENWGVKDAALTTAELNPAVKE